MRETLIITRPAPAAAGFAEAVAQVWPDRFRPIIAPLIAIVPLPGTPDLAGLDGLVFTSPNGVAALAGRVTARDLTAWCVGDATAAAARQAGFAARSAAGDVRALAALIAAEAPGATLLHAGGRHAAGNLASALAPAGIRLRRAVLYDQRPCPLSAAARAAIRHAPHPWVVLFSPRTARQFRHEAAALDTARLTAVAISAAAAAPLADLPLAGLRVAEQPDQPAMIRALAPRAEPPGATLVPPSPLA